MNVLVFETTLKCTHHCMYCYNAYKNHADYPTTELDTESTKALLLKAIREMNCNQVIFTGGEPFLRPDLPELIKTVHAAKKPMSIITNGAMLETSDIVFCKKNGVKAFEITLLSAQKEVHDALARPQGDFSAFDNALWASQEVLKHKLSLVHVFVATRKNVKTLKETLALSYALGCRDFLLNRFNPGGEGSLHIDTLQCSPIELASALKVANDFVIAHPTFKVSCAINIPPCLVDLKQFPFVKMTRCGVGEKQKMYVMDMSGNIRLCSFSSIRVGNLLKTPFKEILKTEKSRQFMQAHPSFCTQCSELKNCQGGCKASADNCYHDACAEDSFLRQYKTKIIQG